MNDFLTQQSLMATPRRTPWFSAKKELSASSYCSEAEFNEEDSISSNNQRMAIRQNSKRSKPFTPGATMTSVCKHLNQHDVITRKSSTTSADALICKQ